MGRGERKVECTSMQGRKNGGERGKNGKKQALKSNGPWVLATPKVYLAHITKINNHYSEFNYHLLVLSVF